MVRRKTVDLNPKLLLQKGMTWGYRLLVTEDSCTWPHTPCSLPRLEGGYVHERHLPTLQHMGIPKRQGHVFPYRLLLNLPKALGRKQKALQGLRLHTVFV